MALTKVSTPAIKDEAITLAKLLHGDANSDGKFLRANNGADPSFETVSIPAGTTINNNADNRLITGSGSANTLNGESNVVINAGKLGIGLTNPAAPIHTHTGNATNYRAFSNTACGGSTGSDGLLLGIDSNANVNIWNFENTYMNFATNGSERLRIQADGDIGLCTTTPNLVGYTSPTVSIGKSGNAYSVLELQGTQTSNGAVGLITGYNTSGNSRIATINWNRQGGNNYGSISFETADNGSLVERVRITNGGLTFNGDTAAANALNDYEEGEATMTAYSNPYVNIHSTYNKMDYTKIGNVVNITGLIIISGVSSTNYFRINLPFTSVNNGNPRRSDAIGVIMHNGPSTGSVGMVAYLPMGSNVLHFYKVSNNSSWSILTNSDLAVNDEMYFTLTYKTA